MKTILFYFYLLLLVMLSSCGNGRAGKDLEPFDSTNEDLDIDTTKNKHIIYDNP